MPKPQRLPLHVALIGYGLSGRSFHAPQILAVPDFKLAAIVSSRQTEIAREHPDVVRHDDPAAVFADPGIDVVVIATPNDSHYALAAQALAHGKAVVVDKPFTVKSAEGRALEAQAAAAGLPLAVFHNRRWDADFRTVRRLIADGTLGEVRYFESHFDRYRPEASGNWREAAGEAGGIWYDLGPHLADQALCLFGRPQAVFADLAIQRPLAAVDYFHVLLRYPSVHVVLAGNYLAADDDLRFVVHGSKASLTISGGDAGELTKRPGKCAGLAARLTLADGSVREVPTEAPEPAGYYAALGAALAAGEKPPVAAEAGIAVMDLLECAKTSSAERREMAF